jgi:hypothetical protein
MRRVWMSTIVGMFVLPLALTLPVLAAGKEAEKATNGTLDTAGIERAIGKAGETKGDVYKLSLSRTDLQVTVDNVKLKPSFALASWIAFKPAAHGAVAHGDIVLAEQEVPAVVQALEAHGIRMTALIIISSVNHPTSCFSIFGERVRRPNWRSTYGTRSARRRRP